MSTISNVGLIWLIGRVVHSFSGVVQKLNFVVFLLCSLCGCQPAPITSLDFATAEGSAEPNLVKGPNGEIVLSYLEPQAIGVALRYTTLHGERWSTPKTVAEGTNWLVNWADFPSVVPISTSTWAAHWLVRGEGAGFAYNAVYAVSHDGGESWTQAKQLHTDNSLVEHGFVSLYPTATGLGAIWLDGRAMAQTPDPNLPQVGTQLRSVLFNVQGNAAPENIVDSLICDCCQTDVAVTESGAIAVYRNRTIEEIRDIYVTRLVNGQWTQGQAVANDGWEITGCPVNGPAIVARGSRVAVAWFSAHPQNKIQVSFSTDSGESFAPAIDLGAQQPLGRVDVALLPNGDAAVSWLQGGKGRLMVKRVPSRGQLGEAFEVAAMATHRDAGFPKMVARGDQLVFAWTETSINTSTIRSAITRL